VLIRVSSILCLFKLSFPSLGKRVVAVPFAIRVLLYPMPSAPFVDDIVLFFPSLSSGDIQTFHASSGSLVLGYRARDVGG